MPKWKFSPEQPIEDVGLKKEAVFEEQSLELRKAIEAALVRQRDLTEVWRRGEKIDGQDATTERCLERFIADLDRKNEHPVIRLGAFEHLMQLMEKDEPANRRVLEEALTRVLTEADETVQEAMLGILGSRLYPTMSKKEIDAAIAARLNDRGTAMPDKMLGRLPERLDAQREHTTETLIKWIAADPSAPEELRDFAQMYKDGFVGRGSDMHKRMMYSARLYGGDVRELWPTLAELKKPEISDSQAFRRVPWLGEQRGRRRLTEGFIPSTDKEIQAENQPRVYGSEDEVGRVIPLRLYLVGETRAEKSETMFAEDWQRRGLVADLRRIRMDRALTRTDRQRARDKCLAEWKVKVFKEIPVSDHPLFQSPEDITLRIETLVDENLVDKILAEKFGTDDLDKIDPTKELRQRIDAALTVDDDAKAQEARVRKVVAEWRA